MTTIKAGEIWVKDCSTSGLRVASTVRLSRIDCLEKYLLITKLGQLSRKDGDNLPEVWKAYIKPQF